MEVNEDQYCLISDILQNIFLQKKENHTGWEWHEDDFALFAFWQVIVTTPMEMLKIQMQDAGRRGKGYTTVSHVLGH